MTVLLMRPARSIAEPKVLMGVLTAVWPEQGLSRYCLKLAVELGQGCTHALYIPLYIERGIMYITPYRDQETLILIYYFQPGSNTCRPNT